MNMVDPSGRATMQEYALLLSVLFVQTVNYVKGLDPNTVVAAVSCMGKGIKNGYDLIGTLLSELTDGKWNLPYHDEPGPDDPFDIACKILGH